MRKIISLGFVLILLSSCRKEEKPKVIYTKTKNAEPTELKVDSSLVKISDTPIHYFDTKYLIHPIGEYRMSKSRSNPDGFFGSGSYNTGSFSISNYNGSEIRGNFHNLKFQRIDSDIITNLSTKNIRIKSVTFLRDIYDNSEKQILVYRVFDKDTNRDNKLDNNDIETLYISKIDGTAFTKITTEFQQLIDWKEIKIMNRLYFRSIEDTNKNGEFDNLDNIHYHFVDFNQNKQVVTEYNPI